MGSFHEKLSGGSWYYTGHPSQWWGSKSQTFARSLYNLSWSYKILDNPQEFEKVWKEIGDYLDSMDRYAPETAVMFLQLFKGYSRNEAVAKIDKIMQESNKTDGKE